MKRGFDRSQRVGDLIQKTLAQLLMEMNDSRFRFVSITGVNMSRDLSYAKIFISMLEEDVDKIAETVKALNHMAKPLRYELAQAVKLRIAPELKFVYDESSARGFRLSTLIDQAIKKENK